MLSRGVKYIIPKQVSLTAEQYRAMVANGSKPLKYRNKPMVFEGVRYHSKAELAFEMRLRLLKANRVVSYWLRQVPFSMPADTNTERAERYLLDALVVMTSGQIRLCEVKGFMTGLAKSKIATISATYHVSIEIIRPNEVDAWI